jgi:hypothetical protein
MSRDVVLLVATFRLQGLLTFVRLAAPCIVCLLLVVFMVVCVSSAVFEMVVFLGLHVIRGCRASLLWGISPWLLGWITAWLLGWISRLASGLHDHPLLLVGIYHLVGWLLRGWATLTAAVVTEAGATHDDHHYRYNAAHNDAHQHPDTQAKNTTNGILEVVIKGVEIEHALVTVVPAVIIEVRLQRLINASVVVALERIIITSTRGGFEGVEGHVKAVVLNRAITGEMQRQGVISRHDVRHCQRGMATDLGDEVDLRHPVVDIQGVGARGESSFQIDPVHIEDESEVGGC